ncbi:MAG: AraC family transcriptional regulator [Betaproteobacteria bacterium]|nr:AraC family transcriptional regulator [Betaproteobacteria bacterium]
MLIRTYSTAERAKYGDFWIRNETRAPLSGQVHRHEFFQIQLNVEGRTRHYIGSTERWLEPGSIAFVLPYRVHLGGRPAGSRFYVINFELHFLFPDLEADPLELETIPLQRAPALAPFLFQEFMDFRLEAADFDVALRACEKMMEEHARRALFSLEIIRANLLQLIGTVCERYERELLALATAHAQRGHRADSLSRVTRYLRENLAGRITLGDAARAANVSPNYLTNLLKRETGKTFTEIVTSRRMEKARELLAYTTLRVSEIAQSAGFKDEAYFTRRFRQYFRVSPLAYRSITAPAALR